MKLMNKDTCTLTPVEGLPEELRLKDLKIKVSREGFESINLTVTGATPKQAYFKGQHAVLKAIFAGASKANPVELDVEVE